MSNIINRAEDAEICRAENTRNRPVISIKAGDSAARILAACLQNIKDHGPLFDITGICTNIGSELDKTKINSSSLERPVMELFGDLCRIWPERAEDMRYPVPHPVKGGHSKSAYMSLEKWDVSHKGPSGEYALLRWKLLEFALAKAKEVVESEKGASHE